MSSSKMDSAWATSNEKKLHISADGLVGYIMFLWIHPLQGRACDIWSFTVVDPGHFFKKINKN